eukprot:7289607-Pyramimonas_sp.AAC.1
MTMKVWGKMTKHRLTESCDRKAGFWDAAVRKSSALQSALLTLVLDETRANLDEASQATFFQDLEKFYDLVDLDILAVRASEVEYPPVGLYMCIMSYLCPRLVKANKIFSDLIVPDNGMVPGCGKANHGARALLYHVLEEVHLAAPIATLRQFVDDIMVRVEGPEEVVGAAVSKAASVLVGGCLKARLRISN